MVSLSQIVLGGAVAGAIVPGRHRRAALLAGARVVVGTDTGLTHLAGALGVPVAGIYCATDPAGTGLYGCARAVNLGGVNAAPPVEAVVPAVRGMLS